MARRKPPTAADILDNAVGAAVDNLFDRAEGWMERVREQPVLSEEYRQRIFICNVRVPNVCVDRCPLAGMEQVHPSNGFGMCKPCYRYMWITMRQHFQALSRQAVQAAKQAHANRPPPPPPEPKRRSPWEVLGVNQDATIDDIRKAYRREAAKWHPDMVPPGSPSSEKEEALARYLELTRARDAMLKVRQPPRS